MANATVAAIMQRIPEKALDDAWLGALASIACIDVALVEQAAWDKVIAIASLNLQRAEK